MHKSENCVQNEHGLCEDVTIEAAYDSQITKICEWQCHDNMYNLAQRMLAVDNTNCPTKLCIVAFV